MDRWCWGLAGALCVSAGVSVILQRAGAESRTVEEAVMEEMVMTEAPVELGAAAEVSAEPGADSVQKEVPSDFPASDERKKIALTFDDGPHPVYTQQMLNLLKERQVPATFFLLGQNVEEYGDLVKEIADEGHLIGNHTYHHVQITTLSTEQAYEEIDETSRLIEELTGQGTEYVRPPFGTWNEGLEAELDLIPVMWTIDTLDWTTGNVDWIVNQVVKNAEENDIILMHDSYRSTVQAVDRIITLLEADGFEFVTVDQVIMD